MPMLGHHVSFVRQNVLGITTEEGVYELSSENETLFFGWTGDDPYGLRGRLESHLRGDAQPGPDLATLFRFEVNARPEAHILDLLAEFEHEHGFLPKFNELATGVNAA